MPSASPSRSASQLPATAPVRLPEGRRPVVAEIDLAALRANLALCRRAAGGRPVIAVIKADAYGHGAVPVARALVAAGCERLAVLTVDEAEPLREAAVDAPLLVLGGAHDAAEAERAVRLGTTPVVHDAEGLRRVAGAARRAGRRVPVHVEVDTGMRRMGVPPAEAVGLLAAAAGEPSLVLEGTFTHFACADEEDLSSSLEQARRFRAILADAAGRGVRPPCVHAANSAAVFAGPALAEALPEANAVRPGLALYGARPAPHQEGSRGLRPVMTLVAAVVAVRAVEAGESVGYGATWRAARPGRVATLAAGYADGVPRELGGRGVAWLAGARRPFAGRVSMDYVSVDAGDAAVRPGDAAVLFGAAGAGALPVEEVAETAGTIAYELLVRVGARVPRVYHE